MTRRTLAALAFAACLLVLGAGAALAHVDLEPGEAVAGSTTTLTFSFHHGKDGSATTGLEVLLPAGSVAVEAPPVPGWTAEVDAEAGTVTWSGGRVPDGTEAAFPLVVQLPPEPGVALFKTIQLTEAGELAWIQEEEGEVEGSYPAPRLTLVPDPNPTTTASSTTSTSAPAITETTEDRPGTTLEAQARDDGGSPAPWLIGSGVAAALAVGVGGMLLKRRAGG
ncbi:MAG: DUF1775 domain-containing protein [Acidimicrobiales bacterium]